MSGCPDFEARLNDYLDEELAPAERAELERHLEGCAGCRMELAALGSLREQAASLPRSAEPARDLWPDIRASLPARRPGPFRPLPGFPSWALGWGSLVPAAASVVVVLFIAIALVVTLRRGAVAPAPGGAGIPGAPPAPAAPAAAVAAGSEQESLQAAEAEYRAATEKLLAALRRESGGASTEGVKVIEENLRIVDAAIAEIRRAAEEQPGRSLDSRVVAGLYRTRFELLRQAVRLASQGGEEKKS